MLLRLRSGARNRVGIAMRNLPEYIVSYIAVTSIGAIAVLLNAWWTPKVGQSCCDIHCGIVVM